MKKVYIKPALTIIEVKQAEIICTSGGGGYGPLTTGDDWGDLENGDINWGI